jgi:hypothetical protein
LKRLNGMQSNKKKRVRFKIWCIPINVGILYLFTIVNNEKISKKMMQNFIYY